MDKLKQVDVVEENRVEGFDDRSDAVAGGA